MCYERKRIFQGKNASQAPGHILSYAVADHRCRLDAPGHPEFRKCVLDHKHGRLRKLCLHEQLFRLFYRPIGGK